MLMEMGPSEQQPAQPGWQFTPDGTAPVNAAPAAPQPTASTEGIQWSASEFVAHQKSAGWYFILLFGAAVATALIYVLTRDLVAVSIIILVVITFAIAAARKPRTLQYQVDNSGVHIGQKSYPYGEFKSFSIIDQDAINYIDLLPMKRFMPSISIYYEPKDEAQITTVISQHLPLQPGQRDMIDNLLHRIRF